MLKTKLLWTLSLSVVLLSCRTTNSGLSNAPTINRVAVSQSGPWVGNKCNQGGHQGQTTGIGWTFDARQGCYLDCASEDVAKADFLDQLKRHRIYGDINLLRAQDPDGADVARYYNAKQRSAGIMGASFATLTKEQLFNGSRWNAMKDTLKPGDILLNMAFGMPNRAGAFYSKRGMIHAALVLAVTDTSFKTFDGGWQQYSVLAQVASQSIWLRPRAAYFNAADLSNLLKWAETLKRAGYDNTLNDDWRLFRKNLDSNIDKGMERHQAAKMAFDASASNNFAPNGYINSFKFVPPSGLYCSEGASAIFAYLGYRQYGDTPIQLVTAFSQDGALPEWALYPDALEGFSADEGKTLIMHKTFWGYFSLFDQARKLGLITIPGLPNAKTVTFAQAMDANLKAVAIDNGESDLIQKQLSALQVGLSSSHQNPNLLTQVTSLQQGFTAILAGWNKLHPNQPLNLSQMAYNIFGLNVAYGPHTFFENSKYFELKGVFYNTDPNFEARWVADFSQGAVEANISTTMYRIKSDASLPADHCVIAEPAPQAPGA